MEEEDCILKPTGEETDGSDGVNEKKPNAEDGTDAVNDNSHLKLENCRKRKCDEDEDNDEPFEAVIKLSPSDLEMSESDDEDGEDVQDSDDIQIKDEIESEDYDSSSGLSNQGNLSPSWKGSSDEETEKVPVVKKVTTTKVADKKKATKTKKLSSVPKKGKRPRGRPKQPRRLKVPEGMPDNYTSDEDEESNKPVLRPGSGYPVEFKLKVLKYADTHSNAATAEKFGLQPKRVRDWKRTKHKIEEESKGAWKRRPRTDGYTVEEKLQAVAFASERSTDEARLLYNVDRRTIEKWKAKKEQLEARLQQGEGNYIRRGGSGRKPRFTQIEENLRDWIIALRMKGVTVNYKMILNKAKIIMEEDKTSTLVPKVPRTRTWVIGFLKRQNLHGLLGTTLGHEDPQELLNAKLKTKDGEGDIKVLADQMIEIPENPNKRNRRTISLEDKVNIIRRIEQGETQGTVAKSLKVATSTIQTIWSCRNEILHKYVNPKSKTKSDALIWKIYNAIGAALLDWLEQTTARSIKVDSSMLMEKAIQLSETYRMPQFGSEAKQWLRIFCKKHNLSDLLVELRSNNSGSAGSGQASVAINPQIVTSHQSLPTPINTTTNITINSVESSNHHDDELHSDFTFNDLLSVIHVDPQNRHSIHSLQPPPPSQHSLQSQQQHIQPHHTHSSPVENSQRFSTSCNTGPHFSVTSTDAIKYINLLRNWIQSNYGPQEEILNTHLSVIENAALRKQMGEIRHSNNQPH